MSQWAHALGVEPYIAFKRWTGHELRPRDGHDRGDRLSGVQVCES